MLADGLGWSVVCGDGIFSRVNGDLVVLQERPYDTEEFLQRALAEHPEVIAGESTVGGDSGKLLLVQQETGVPATPEASPPCGTGRDRRTPGQPQR